MLMYAAYGHRQGMNGPQATFIDPPVNSKRQNCKIHMAGATKDASRMSYRRKYLPCKHVLPRVRQSHRRACCDL